MSVFVFERKAKKIMKYTKDHIIKSLSSLGVNVQQASKAKIC